MRVATVPTVRASVSGAAAAHGAAAGTEAAPAPFDSLAFAAAAVGAPRAARAAVGVRLPWADPHAASTATPSASGTSVYARALMTRAAARGHSRRRDRRGAR